MPEATTFEKIVIICSLIIGFLGAVILVYFEQPSIIISVFLATGISTLVYYFLGGISDANFNMGSIKLGGSIAALIASSWLINSQLENQISSIDSTLTLNSKKEIKNKRGKILGKITFENSHFSLGKELNIYLNDSIKLGKLDLDTLRLHNNFRVISNKINIGTLAPEEFTTLGLFRKSNLSSYAEIKYDLRMSPFGSIVNTNFWEEPNRSLQNSYNQLPFKIEPVFKNGSDRTLVIIGDKTFDEKLERGSVFHIEVGSKKSTIYYVRVRNLTRNLDKTSYQNSIIYQIFEIKKTITQ